jgi:hypothetical protein
LYFKRKPTSPIGDTTNNPSKLFDKSRVQRRTLEQEKKTLNNNQASSSIELRMAYL